MFGIIKRIKEAFLPELNILIQEKKRLTNDLNQLSNDLNRVSNHLNRLSDDLSRLTNNFNHEVASLEYIHNSTVSEKSKLYSKYRISDSVIGDYTYVAPNCSISMTTIGKFCSIGPNLISGWGIHPLNGISTSPMFYSTLKQNGTTLSETDKAIERSSIKIGNDVFIGMNVSILDGVEIGDGAVIAAGSVVNKNIPPYAIAAGVPCKVVKYRFSTDIIEKLLQLEWWNFEGENLREVEKSFFNVESFLERQNSK